jgi:hypothetical protein
MNHNCHQFLRITINFPPTELETPAMATALEDNTTSATRLQIPRNRTLQADIKPVNEPRPGGGEEKGDYIKAKDVSSSTQETSITDLYQ